MRVHIHANCQAVPLAGLLNEAEPDWEISYFEVHANDIIDNVDEYHHKIQSADLVLTQPIHRGFRNRDDLSVDWVRANIRKDATLLVFPSMHFAGHHPGLDALPLAGLPFLSSLLVGHLIAAGETQAAALDRILSDNFISESEIETEIQVAMNEMKRREVEDGLDVFISPFFDENCRTKTVFHIQNHPFREAMVFIANRLLAHLGRAARAPVEGRDYQPDVHIPPLPSVARFLDNRRGGRRVESLDMVLLPGHPAMTQAEYYGHMMDVLARYTPDEIFQVIEKRWPTVQVLRRLAAQGSTIPGIARWLGA